MDNAILFKDLTFAYRESPRPALRDIRGGIDEGRFVVVMGHEGGGKSTLCYAVNGLVPRFFRGHYEGSVLVKGHPVAVRSVAEMSRTVGMVFQDFEAQLFSTNVELEMAFGPENRCVPRQEIEERIRYYLPLAGLEGLRSREPASLSGGQKQRLAVASVLTMEPEILVMDEPTTDLDPRGCEELLSVARGLAKRGRTLLLVDHDPEVAAGADEVWLMREGERVAAGPPAEILGDLSLLASCGVRPPSAAELFFAMGWPGRPLTAQRAIDLMDAHRLVQPMPLNQEARPSEEPGSPIILQAEALRYAYPTHGVEALAGIDLSIGEGEFIAILGQNGSGKSTLAKQFNGLLKPTSGRMLVEGKPTTLWGHREMARKVGYVFQNPDHQIFARSVAEEVGFGLKVLGEGPRMIRQRVAEALGTVGLSGHEGSVPFALTKGERQRVAVASVLAARPRVIVLDEPTTGLDYSHQRSMMEMLRRLNQEGHTIVVITHAMWVAAEYARRTIVLKDGAILLDGPTRRVFAQDYRLAEAALRPPPLARLSNWLGSEALTLEGMVRELKVAQMRNADCGMRNPNPEDQA
jgi:energy-coupling factor transport system ATP-binding protein